MLKNTLKALLGNVPINIRPLYTAVRPRDRRIPNHVYQTWIQPVLPMQLAYKLWKFRRLNRDCSFSFFDDRGMAEYMESNYVGHPILNVFHSVRMPAEKADIWRYCILFREGGIYCDIKSVIRVPLSTMIGEEYSELISFEENLVRDYLDVDAYADPQVFLRSPPERIKEGLEHPDHVVLNWFLCFEKGNPILQEVIDLIVQHSSFYRGRRFERPDRAGNHFTGPLALTQAVWRWMARSGGRPRQCGIDFSGQGVWRMEGMDYSKSPHHSSLRDLPLLD